MKISWRQDLELIIISSIVYSLLNYQLVLI